MSFHAASYTPIRDDSGLKSLSTVERDFVRSCALSKTRILRTDGRNWNQLRNQRLHLTRWENGANSTVQWGTGTRVSCTCTAELIPPNPDRPSEGMITMIVDLSPSASTAFRQATPAVMGASTSSYSRGFAPDEDQKLTSNRILRCLERILLTGGALDSEALCVTPEHWVWKLQLNVTVLDAGGNLLDAAVLACMAALRHYRKPHVQLDSEAASSAPTLVPSELKEPTPLPLHHTPLSVSFALIPEEDVMRSSTLSTSSVTVLVDPDAREELVATGLLTIAMNIHSEVCLLDYGGGCELQPDKLRECYKLAASSIQQLCHSLETSLKQADEQALQERLQRLQHRQHPDVIPPPELPKDVQGIPYYQAADHKDDFMQVVDSGNDDEAAATQAQSEAEEAYRRQALDYNVGHLASKVREDSTKKKQDRQASSLLLAAMLQSVKGVASPEEKKDTQQKNVEDVSAPENKVEFVSIQVDEPKDEKMVEKKKARKPSKTEPPAASKAGALDSDEEESTMQLESEFQAVPAPADTAVDDDDDISDLAAAIKKKKKKSKKGKK